MNNPFVLEDIKYQRDLNFLNNYLEQSSVALSKLRGIDINEARSFIKQIVGQDGSYPFKDTITEHTFRDSRTGDRTLTKSGLFNYLTQAIKDNDIVAPTLTRYTHPSIKESPLVDSIDNNVAHRAVNKRTMFDALMKGDTNLATAKNQEQTGNKLSNNSLSGGHVSASTILYNKSAHSTLTSTCRITSGFGNANNEKLLSGHRHYHGFDVVINNITSIVSLTDLNQLNLVMKKYNLYYPNSDEVYKVITKNTEKYWYSKTRYEFIKEYLDKLSPIELSAVAYIGDLWTIKEYNDTFLRTFIGELIHNPNEEHPEAENIISKANDDFKSLANQLQGSEIKGIGLSNAKGTPIYKKVASTIVNIEKVLDKYRDFIQAFFATPNVPASLGYFPFALRETALASDTDSTIFTVQEWVKWYKGDYVMDDLGNSVCAAMIFIASQNIIHILAIMSANIGVERKRLHQIAMKNEFRFDGFAVTNETKHYYGLIGCREGNVFDKLKQEIKGVHLKNSAVPIEIMDKAADFMQEILQAAISGNQLSMIDIINMLRAIEKEISDKIKEGKSDYFVFNQIKSKDSYRLPENQSPYYHYTLWQEVFAPKYGETEPPPYTALKVNTTIKTNKEFNDWLDNMEDKALSFRFKQWCEKNTKDKVISFQLPMNIVNERGVPEEIFSMIDIRRAIVDNTSVFYKILETLGLPILDKNLTTLVSDY